MSCHAGRDEIEYKALPSGPGGASKKALRKEVGRNQLQLLFGGRISNRGLT